MRKKTPPLWRRALDSTLNRDEQAAVFKAHGCPEVASRSMGHRRKIGT